MTKDDNQKYINSNNNDNNNDNNINTLTATADDGGEDAGWEGGEEDRDHWDEVSLPFINQSINLMISYLNVEKILYHLN